jgi:exonuclease VII small subunit
MAIKLAIRRNPRFRFDYFLRSLPIDVLARRCEQLMKGAEKEVEHLERNARELAGLPTEPEKDGEKLPSIELPSFRVLQLQRRINASIQAEKAKKELEKQVADIESQIRMLQSKLKAINEGNMNVVGGSEAVASTVNPVRKVREVMEREEELKIVDSEAMLSRTKQSGAIGPGGSFVEFPQYDGIEHPAEWRKPFSHFCNQKRKEVKLEMTSVDRKDKVSFLVTT